MRMFLKVWPLYNTIGRLYRFRSNGFNNPLHVIPAKYDFEDLSYNNSTVTTFNRTTGNVNRNQEKLNLPMPFCDMSLVDRNLCQVEVLALIWQNMIDSRMASAVNPINDEPKNFREFEQLHEKIQMDNRAHKCTTNCQNSHVSNVYCFGLLREVLSNKLKKMFLKGSLKLDPLKMNEPRYFYVRINFMPHSLSQSNVINKEASNLKVQKMYGYNQTFLKNSVLLTLSKKLFSTRAAWQQTPTPDVKNCSKFDPNYCFPHLSIIFGNEDLLMRSDAYNQALVDATKRRADVARQKSETTGFKNFDTNRPKLKNIKGCNAFNQSRSYSPSKHPTETDVDKKHTSYKLSEYPNASENVIWNGKPKGNEEFLSETVKNGKEIDNKYNGSFNAYKLLEYSNDKREKYNLWLQTKESDQVYCKNTSKLYSSKKGKFAQITVLDGDIEYKQKGSEDRSNNKAFLTRNKKTIHAIRRYKRKQVLYKRKGDSIDKQRNKFEKKTPCVESALKEEPFKNNLYIDAFNKHDLSGKTENDSCQNEKPKIESFLEKNSYDGKIQIDSSNKKYR